MDTRAAQLDLLMDIEARHDNLMLRLEALDKRVERTLAECQGYRVGMSGSSSSDCGARPPEGRPACRPTIPLGPAGAYNDNSGPHKRVSPLPPPQEPF